MKLFAILTFSFLIIALCENCRDTGSGSKKTDETFVQPTDVQGVSCSYVVYYDDGKMKSCVLAREDTLSGQSLPLGTIVFFSRDGVMESCFLQRDTEIQGHLCKGRSDNWSTAFHPNGELKLAWLAKDEIIQDVPCASVSFWKDAFGSGAGTYFFADGKLRGCKLAQDATVGGLSFRKGDHVAFEENGKVKAGR